ncbi:MAG: hypothetical protein IJU76_05905 [Desulfovibrionaceae bacterium]|nr:hypothetical protein [Desulfovibrionaceae bacterium]
MSEKWIEIARIGTFIDSAGREQTFTQADLDAIAKAYDPVKRDAPLVFGHPQSDAAPAFGWAKTLKSQNGKLLAQFAHVPDQVKNLVAQKHYRHVSMSLMPDRVTLRHVALLGAAQPAIDGLAAVEFHDGGDDAITVDFAVPTNGGNSMTLEEAQRKIGQLESELTQIKAENAKLKKRGDDAEKGKADAEKGKADAEKKAADTAADFAAFRSQVESEKREARISALVAAGKITPAEKAGILEFAARLGAQQEPFDFAASDGKVEKISLEERYMRELEARPVDGRFTDFSAPPAHADLKEPGWNADDITKKL